MMNVVIHILSETLIYICLTSSNSFDNTGLCVFDGSIGDQLSLALSGMLALPFSLCYPPSSPFPVTSNCLFVLRFLHVTSDIFHSFVSLLSFFLVPCFLVLPICTYRSNYTNLPSLSTRARITPSFDHLSVIGEYPMFGQQTVSGDHFAVVVHVTYY